MGIGSEFSALSSSGNKRAGEKDKERERSRSTSRLEKFGIKLSDDGWLVGGWWWWYDERNHDPVRGSEAEILSVSVRKKTKAEDYRVHWSEEKYPTSFFYRPLNPEGSNLNSRESEKRDWESGLCVYAGYKDKGWIKNMQGSSITPIKIYP